MNDQSDVESDLSNESIDEELSFIRSIPFRASTTIHDVSVKPNTKITEIMRQDGCEHLFSEEDIQNCMKMTVTHEFSSFDLCKMFLSAFFQSYLNTSFAETDGILINTRLQQKTFFFKKYIHPLRHKTWPFAFKLFIANQVAFSEKRLRNINELVFDETHYGLRALLLCRNRIQSQSFIQSYRDWLENASEEKQILCMPEGLCEQLIQTALEHAAQQNVHKTLKKRAYQYHVEPFNGFAEWSGKKKQKLIELIHSFANDLDE
jgi:hypothetical protein